MANKPNVDVKCVLLGTQSAGKTCLVDRYLYETWNQAVSATVGAAFGAKKVNFDSVTITLGIWDTAGAERYEAMSRLYYRQAQAAIVCFDVCNQQSWSKVKFWIDELISNEPTCEIYVVGTKQDMVAEGVKKREVDGEAVKSFMKSVPTAKNYMETSAKTGHNVDNLFNAIAQSALAKYEAASGPMFTGSVAHFGKNTLLKPPNEGKKKCC